MRKIAPLFFLCWGVSCWEIQPKSPESSGPPNMSDTSTQHSTPDERDLLKQKVEEISERQRKTEEKVERILEHVEGQKTNKPIVINLDAHKRQELRKGWEEIESQKVSAIEGIKSESSSQTPENLPSGIVSPEE